MRRRAQQKDHAMDGSRISRSPRRRQAAGGRLVAPKLRLSPKRAEAALVGGGKTGRDNHTAIDRAHSLLSLSQASCTTKDNKCRLVQCRNKHKCTECRKEKDRIEFDDDGGKRLTKCAKCKKKCDEREARYKATGARKESNDRVNPQRDYDKIKASDAYQQQREASRAATAARHEEANRDNPELLDVVRTTAEKGDIIVPTIFASVAMQLSDSDSVLILSTGTIRVGARYSTAMKNLRKEALLSFRNRGGKIKKDKTRSAILKPMLRHTDGSYIPEAELWAVARLELLYTGDRIEENATGSGNYGEGAIEGLLIYELEKANGGRLGVASGGRILNRRHTAPGSHMGAGWWGVVAALVIEGGWEKQGWSLWDGDRLIATPSSPSSISSSSSSAAPAASLLAMPPAPANISSVRPSGDSWRTGSETNKQFWKRACKTQRRWKAFVRPSPDGDVSEAEEGGSDVSEAEEGGSDVSEAGEDGDSDVSEAGEDGGEGASAMHTPNPRRARPMPAAASAATAALSSAYPQSSSSSNGAKRFLNSSTSSSRSESLIDPRNLSFSTVSSSASAHGVGAGPVRAPTDFTDPRVRSVFSGISTSNSSSNREAVSQQGYRHSAADRSVAAASTLSSSRGSGPVSFSGIALGGTRGGGASAAAGVPAPSAAGKPPFLPQLPVPSSSSSSSAAGSGCSDWSIKDPIGAAFMRARQLLPPPGSQPASAELGYSSGASSSGKRSRELALYSPPRQGSGAGHGQRVRYDSIPTSNSGSFNGNSSSALASGSGSGSGASAFQLLPSKPALRSASVPPPASSGGATGLSAELGGMGIGGSAAHASRAPVVSGTAPTNDDVIDLLSQDSEDGGVASSSSNSSSAAAAGAAHAGHAAGTGGQRIGRVGAKRAAAVRWSCRACTCDNAPAALQCEACWKARPF